MLNKGQSSRYKCTDWAVPTNTRHPVDLLHRTWQGTEEADDQPNYTKDQGAGAVVRQDVHQDVECQDVTGHEENQQQKLANSQYFTTNPAHQELASVSHAVNLGMTKLELANFITRVP